MAVVTSRKEQIVYPESDGKPMADNTKQFRWIVTLEGGFEALFRDREDVFVAGDLFWYPVEGRPDIRMAPDVMIVFGRPKGDRPSYKQWEEGEHRAAGGLRSAVAQQLAAGDGEEAGVLRPLRCGGVLPV
jgi:hypothetical protein